MIEAKKAGRFEEIDIMKGLLIILVVMGHTNTPFTKWIYSFHMAAFFAISGFLWRDQYVSDRQYMLKFITGRIKRLYIPFVTVNVVFILLNNLLIRMGIYTTDPMFLEITSEWPTKQSLASCYDLKEIVISSCKAFFLISGSASLVSTCWFLAALFLISFVHFAVSLLLRGKSGVIRRTVTWILCIGCLLIAFVNQEYGIPLPGGIRRCFPAYAAFLMGCLIKLYLPRIRTVKPWIWIMFAFGGFIMLVLDPRSVEMSRSYIVNPLYFCLGFTHGVVICYFVAAFLKRTVFAKEIMLLGEKSMSIMLFHVLSFKLVNYGLICLYQRDIIYLASKPVIFDLPQFWSLAYTIIGIGLPIAADICIDNVKSRFFVRTEAHV